MGLLQPVPPPIRPFEQVMMDLITHLPLTEGGYDAVATFIDRFSKMTYFVPIVGTIDAAQFAQVFFQTVVCRHGMPDCVISDRDCCFVS